MNARLVVFHLVLALGLVGSVQAHSMGEGAWAPVDEPGAAPDTVFMARMPPLEVVAERIVTEPSSTMLVASAASLQEDRTAARTRSSDTQPQGRASQSGDPSGGAAARSVGIGGFVMNETFSVVGNDFYTAFYSAWSEPEEAGLYTVAVQEEPSPQFGARLTVHVDDTTIFRTFLRPNNRKIRKAAQTAAERARVYITKYYEPRHVY
jgi:hypothetical protein